MTKRWCWYNVFFYLLGSSPLADIAAVIIGLSVAVVTVFFSIFIHSERLSRGRILGGVRVGALL